MDLDDIQIQAMTKAEDRGGMLQDIPINGIPLWICHKKHSFNATMKQILKGIWCTECNESIGERALREYLEKRKIRFQTEKTFPGLRDKNILRFDFWCPEYELAIEIDGEFHFKKLLTQEELEKLKSKRKKGVKKPNAAKKLINQIEHDIEKDNWCKETKNSMLRIPFWELPQLEKIIDEKIKEIDRDNRKNIKKTYYWCSYAGWRIEALKSLKSKGKNKIPMPKSPAPRGTCKKTKEDRQRRLLSSKTIDSVTSSLLNTKRIKLSSISKKSSARKK